MKSFQPIRIDQGSPAHWALRSVAFLAVAYLALSPFFRSLKANDTGSWPTSPSLASPHSH